MEGGYKMTGGISATRQLPPPHTLDMPLPSGRNKESLPPHTPSASVNLISRMMSQSCLWGQGLGDGQRNEFIAVCPVTPPIPFTGCRAELPLFKLTELCCSGRAGGHGGCGWGWFSVNVLIA